MRCKVVPLTKISVSIVFILYIKLAHYAAATSLGQLTHLCVAIFAYINTSHTHTETSSAHNNNNNDSTTVAETATIAAVVLFQCVYETLTQSFQSINCKTALIQ